MSFFEPPPPPGPREGPRPRYRMPNAWGPPEGVLGGIVPIEKILGRTEDVAVGVSRITAYAAGFEFEVFTLARLELDLEPFDFSYRGRRRSEGEIDPEVLRFGVEFADGRKATNLQAEMPFEPSREDGTLALIEHGGGGGGGGDWRQGYWVPELPPDGPLAFVAEWPAVGLPLTRLEIDSSVVREAAARSEVVWDLPDAPAGFYEDESDD